MTPHPSRQKAQPDVTSSCDALAAEKERRRQHLAIKAECRKCLHVRKTDRQGNATAMCRKAQRVRRTVG